MARAKLKEPRSGTCVVQTCGKPFVKDYYQQNTCSDECWEQNRRERWEHLRLTEGCARCKRVKPLTEYTGYTTPYCKSCFNTDRRDRFTPDDYRRQNLKKYRLTPEAFDEILRRQAGQCAICRTDNPGGRHGTWHVDHDHQCCPTQRSCGACIRGLLCGNCNILLGNGQDDPAILRAAAEYLERPRQPGLFAVA